MPLRDYYSIGYLIPSFPTKSQHEKKSEMGFDHVGEARVGHHVAGDDHVSWVNLQRDDLGQLCLRFGYL